jgi:hypothetical protein
MIIMMIFNMTISYFHQILFHYFEDYLMTKHYEKLMFIATRLFSCNVILLNIFLVAMDIVFS